MEFELMVIYGTTFSSMLIFGFAGALMFGKGWGGYEDQYLEGVGKTFDSMFLTIPPQHLAYLSLLSFLTIFLTIAAAFDSPGAGFLFGLSGFFTPTILVKQLKKKRDQKFVTQLIDALENMKNALHAGFSLPQAFDLVVREQPAPIKQEFHILAQEMRLGVPMEDALKNLWRRMPSEDMQLFMIAVNISKEVGGDLMSVFSTIAHTIRERFRIEGKIQAMTGQGRMQGMVVGLMPPAMGVILNVIDPVMTSLLWKTFVGWIMIITVAIMEIIGYLWIQAIVNIDI